MLRILRAGDLFLAWAGATVLFGAKLVSAGNGTLRTLAPGTDDPLSVVGTALEAVTITGDPKRVEIRVF